MNNIHVDTSRNGVKKSFPRCRQKAFDFVDKTRVKVSNEKFTANANYDMEIKIQGRIHLGKLRITVERQVNLK